jgi:hypothetical protein
MRSGALRCVDSTAARRRASFEQIFTPKTLGCISRGKGESIRNPSIWLQRLATLIRYDDGRQQLQGKAAKTLADAILKSEVE